MTAALVHWQDRSAKISDTTSVYDDTIGTLFTICQTNVALTFRFDISSVLASTPSALSLTYDTSNCGPYPL